jgi:hypothetical protein
MRTSPFALPALVVLLASAVAGCSSGPAPETPAAPPAARDTTSMGFGRIMSGSSDSVGAVPGSADALYRYRFRLVDPASDRFTFQDRELSFYFRPTPDALFFQVENRTDKPVWLDWDRCTFTDPLGTSGRAAHSTTTLRERYGTQASTQILGLQRYGDYLFPIDYLIEQAATDQPVHRALFPEDENAPQYSGREFGTEMTFRIDGQPRTYAFHFRVMSVIPNR